jgi:hypothetical protein
LTEQPPVDDSPERQIRAARQQIAFLWREVRELRDQLADALGRIEVLEAGQSSTASSRHPVGGPQ